MKSVLLKKIVALSLFAVSIFSYSQPPAGYYNNATGKSCATLKTALKTIINTGINPKSYAALKTQYTLTDIKPRTVGTGSTNVIYDIYSTNPGGVDPYQFTPVTDECGNYNSEGDCYNREHSVAQSWFSSSSGQPSPGPGTDYNHIFPTDGEVNARHSNYVFAEVATATWTSLTGNKLGSSATAGISGIVFEPIDSFKGDIARAFLYFVTMYEDDMSSYSSFTDNSRAFAYNTFPSVNIDYLKLMLKWHNLDPVSSKELSRNNGSYSFQGNRNPYVDHPEYVALVWNSSCPGLSGLPVDMISFTGKLQGNNLQLNWEVGTEINVSHYEVELSSNNTTFKPVASIEAKGLHNYSYSQPAEDIRCKRVYFRIKTVDKDGKYTYSKVFTIHIPLNTKFAVYPNPAKDNIQLQLNSNVNTAMQLQVTDIAGKVLLEKTVTAINGIVNLNNLNLQNGSYFIRLKVNDEFLTAKLVVEK